MLCKGDICSSRSQVKDIFIYNYIRYQPQVDIPSTKRRDITPNVLKGYHRSKGAISKKPPFLLFAKIKPPSTASLKGVKMIAEVLYRLLLIFPGSVLRVDEDKRSFKGIDIEKIF